MVIRSFRDKTTEALFNDESPKSFPGNLVKVTCRNCDGDLRRRQTPALKAPTNLAAHDIEENCTPLRSDRERRFLTTKGLTVKNLKLHPAANALVPSFLLFLDHGVGLVSLRSSSGCTKEPTHV